jgi:hypothetical protein
VKDSSLGIFFTPLSTGGVAPSFTTLLACLFPSVPLYPGTQWYSMFQFLLYRALSNFAILLAIYWPGRTPSSWILVSAAVESVKIRAVFLSPIWVQTLLSMAFCSASTMAYSSALYTSLLSPRWNL